VGLRLRKIDVVIPAAEIEMAVAANAPGGQMFSNLLCGTVHGIEEQGPLSASVKPLLALANKSLSLLGTAHAPQTNGEQQQVQAAQPAQQQVQAQQQAPGPRVIAVEQPQRGTVTYVPVAQPPSGYAPSQPAAPTGYMRRTRQAPQQQQQQLQQQQPDPEINVPQGY
jgi:hypothetical protein